MLRLLAQRGEQGYKDIADLKGVSVDDVRSQALDAVRQLEDEGLPPPAIPGLPEAAERPEPSKAEPMAPKPEEPKPAPPAPEEKPPLALPKGEPRPPLRRELKLLENRGLWAILAGAAIVVLFVVILFVGGGDDGGGSETTATGASNSAEETGSETPVTNSKKVTEAVLEPVDGSDAKGTVIFGRVKETLALQVVATGLEPTAKGQSYAIWLAQSPQKMLPLASTPVNQTGKIAAQFEVPVEVLAYLANETFKDITITVVDNDRLEASLAKATKAKESPDYTGTEVLRGTVTGPIVGAQIRKEEAEDK